MTPLTPEERWIEHKGWDDPAADASTATPRGNASAGAPPAIPLSYGNYCQECGRKLSEVRKRAGFDARTGERLYRTDQRCPRRWHQNTPFFEFAKVEQSGASESAPTNDPEAANRKRGNAPGAPAARTSLTDTHDTHATDIGVRP